MADGRIDVTYEAECFILVVGSEGDSETQSICTDEIDELMRDAIGVDAPDLNIFSRTPEVGIKTVENDGLWYVSPMGTMNDAQIELLNAIDQDKLEALIDWAIEAGESNF
jgi:hypothetical protein